MLPAHVRVSVRFNTQPPEGGWKDPRGTNPADISVSTHSRPKAAGCDGAAGQVAAQVSTHSRPKAAGPARQAAEVFDAVSTHSRPKAAGSHSSSSYSQYEFQHTAARRRLENMTWCIKKAKCFNTQPPEGGWVHIGGQNNTLLVVSTHSRPKAAGPAACCPTRHRSVSTHSRPKAAGPAGNCGAAHCCRFNTQPPEGGWLAT